MQYLARWRMQLAATLLSSTTTNLAEIADRVGYGSEAALSRAFKRWVGVAPSAWREGQRPGANEPLPAQDEELETA
jgi:AraC-like DNA-binding protein